VPENGVQNEEDLELEHYIEELQIGNAVHPPMALTPHQAAV